MIQASRIVKKDLSMNVLNCKIIIIIIINLVPVIVRAPTICIFVCFLDAAATVKTLQRNLEDKDLTCRKLKEQLNALEKETAVKLADMDQYKKEIQVSH